MLAADVTCHTACLLAAAAGRNSGRHGDMIGAHVFCDCTDPAGLLLLQAGQRCADTRLAFVR